MEPAAALRLRLLQGDIGVGQAALHVGFAGRLPEGDADAGAGVAGLFAIGDRRGKAADKAVGHAANVLVAARIGTNDHELVAPDAGNHVITARRFSQYRRAILQHVIPGVVADRIVDRFKPVEIDMHERYPRRSIGALRDLLEVGSKAAAVCEAGQRICPGRVFKLFLALAGIGDVDAEADIAAIACPVVIGSYPATVDQLVFPFGVARGPRLQDCVDKLRFMFRSVDPSVLAQSAAQR